jgi:hypothetical protein
MGIGAACDLVVAEIDDPTGLVVPEPLTRSADNFMGLGVRTLCPVEQEDLEPGSGGSTHLRDGSFQSAKAV